MAWKGPAGPSLVEGYSRFCRGCGHDLLGLTGDLCPRCGRASPALVGRPRPRRRDGRRLVVAVVVGGALLALVGLKFRNLTPRPPTPATGPTTLTSPARGR